MDICDDQLSGSFWPEAAIDYQPSRGARNRDADTWVPMDPSYKH